LGFDRFEFWSWWDKDISSIRDGMRELDLKAAAFCTHFISLTDVTLRGAYLSGLSETIKVAADMECDIIISQVGSNVSNRSRAEQKTSIIEGLKAAADLLERTRARLVIEPLNTVLDHKGYFLTRSEEAAEIIQEVGSPRVAMLFDVYHQQMTEGNLIGNLRKYRDVIAHIHVADCPGRHEPGTGEINYGNVLAELARIQYHGCVGIELYPSGPDHAEALRNPLFH
jgi:hydroxypyruvate isomerase